MATRDDGTFDDLAKCCQPSEADRLRRPTSTPSSGLHVGPLEENRAGSSAQADGSDFGKRLLPLVFDTEEEEEEENMSATKSTSDNHEKSPVAADKIVHMQTFRKSAQQQQPRVPPPEKDCESARNESTAASSSSDVTKDIWKFLRRARDAAQSEAGPKTPTKAPPAPPESEDDFLILDDDVPLYFFIPTERKQERSKKASSRDGGSEDNGAETDLPGRKSVPERTARKKPKKNEPALDRDTKKNRRPATDDREVESSSGMPKSSKGQPETGGPDPKTKRKKAQRRERADADADADRASPSGFDFQNLDPAQDLAAGGTFEENGSSPEANRVLGKRKRNPPGEWWVSCSRNDEAGGEASRVKKTEVNRREPTRAKKGLEYPQRAEEGKSKKKKKKKGAVKKADSDDRGAGRAQERQGSPWRDFAPLLFSSPKSTRRNRRRESESRPFPRVSSQKKDSRTSIPSSPEPDEKRATGPPSAERPRRLRNPARERSDPGEETGAARSRSPAQSGGGAVGGRPVGRRAPRASKTAKSVGPSSPGAQSDDVVTVRVYSPDRYDGTFSVDGGPASPDGADPSRDICRSGPVCLIDVEPYGDPERRSSGQVWAELSVSDLCAPPLKPFELGAEDKADLSEWLRFLFPASLKGKKNKSLPAVSPDHFDWYFHKGRAVGVAEDLRCATFSQGKMLLGSFMKKPLWVDHSATTAFFLLTSSVSVVVDNVKSCVHTGNSFMVPCGHAYSVQNLTAQPAVLSFTRIVTESPD
ncbi:nucleolar protein dao-5 [Syngnathoides biaculeatus]|uniref:nucleolar protein dao-5 n=1 Tax=Syngnathoides biaculeatus TaxID=300417 RepID=UPI002ADD4D29|nr:nucleolar protein dao-5 [Syngnathoides biaculeatus]